MVMVILASSKLLELQITQACDLYLVHTKVDDLPKPKMLVKDLGDFSSFFS